jgi:hypothetical protein
VDLPKDDKEFFQLISSYVSSVHVLASTHSDMCNLCRKSSKFGIAVSPEAMQELLNASGGEVSIVKAVRQAFYIATSISPLLMLVPKKYHALRQTIRKDALVAVSLLVQPL